MTYSYAAPGRWVARAACYGHQDMMIMPLVGKPGSYTAVEFQRVQAAVAMCKRCPVLAECRAWALTEPDPAIVLVAGGLTPNQRRDIRMGREPRVLRTPGRPGSAGRKKPAA